MKAVIMAGGSGTRLRPLTCTIPKPMVPILNKPVMEYTIELLALHGIRDIAVTLQYLPDEIMDYFKDGEKWDVHLSYFIETQPLGTAGSVKNARQFLDDSFIVISGDALTDLDITTAIAWHRNKNAEATLVTKNVAVPLEFGVIISDKDNKITRFLEKPSWGEVFSDNANTGIYLFEPNIFDYIDNGPIDFSRDVFPRMLSAGAFLFAYPMEGYWCDIGDIGQYMQANFDLLDGKCKLPVKIQNYNGVYFEDLTELNENIAIEAPSYIGASTRLDPRCHIKKYTVIGKGCQIGAGEIERSILWDHVSIGDYDEINGAILCKESQIEQQSRLFEEAVVGEGSIIGERSTLSAGIRVWPQKKVDACSNQTENVIWGNVRKKVVFSEGSIVGNTSLDLSPQLAAWIGQIFAYQKKGLAIGCDGKDASRMVMSGILSGVVSQNCNALDLNFCTPAILKHFIITMGQNGGIYIRETEPNICKVQLFDERGLSLSRKAEKSLEERYQQQQILKGDIGEVIAKHDIMPWYLQDLLKIISPNEVEHHSYRIVMGDVPEPWKKEVTSLFQRLGCQVIHAPDNIQNTLRDYHGDVGFAFDDLLEQIDIYDEKGNQISNPELLISYLETLFTNIQQIPIPAVFPATSQQYIQNAGKLPIPCKNCTDHALKVALDNNTIDPKDNHFLYGLHFDALCVAVLFLKAMAVTDEFASEIINSLGSYVHRFSDIDCRDRDIGKVMRILSQKGWQPSAEGVTFENNKGNITVYPSKRGSLRISTGSFDSEFSDELLNIYTDQVHHLIETLKDDI